VRMWFTQILLGAICSQSQSVGSFPHMGIVSMSVCKTWWTFHMFS